MKPCQDLSNAGQRKGFNDTSTRSGMLWEVERILTECKELGELPQILLLENVPQLHSIGENMNNFQKWINRLEELGYKSYWQDLIATDYGIPQTRNRCFMVSILGNYSYSFPKPLPLEIKLKNMLEEYVDEKYFLSDKMIEFFKNNEEKQIEKGNGFRFNVSDGNVIAKTITTLAGNRMDDNFVEVKNNIKPKLLRKLTPKECFRLMGVKDEDFEKCAKNQSDSSLYHLAGDSIVANVLMAIFKELI